MTQEEQNRRVAAVAERLAAENPRVPLEAVCAVVQETRALFAHGAAGDFAQSPPAAPARGSSAVG